MPTATVTTLFCVQQATGTDSGVNYALAALPATIKPGEFGGLAVVDAIKAIPGVIAAIDAARSDPDQLYVTANTNGGRGSAIWPAPGEDVEMQGGQSKELDISLEFNSSQNLSLWDADTGGVFGSDDDLLGSVTMYASEQGEGEIVKKAQSAVEGSCYYVAYRVD